MAGRKIRHETVVAEVEKSILGADFFQGYRPAARHARSQDVGQEDRLVCAVPASTVVYGGFVPDYGTDVSFRIIAG